MQSFLTLGEEIAGYRLESVIGRGGMAVVYRAADLRLGRRVALKVIAPHLAENERFRQRFVRESMLAASIDHPNIIPIYDAGEASGLLYTVMRYVDGLDLKALLERERQLDPGQVLDLFSQIASALDVAHAHDLVHRDVKPGNILLARGSSGEDADHAYLTDFGLTKKSVSASDLTTVGHFVGTVDYVAPEQISSKRVDGRADLYALGCAMYQCLAGTLPFDREDDAATLWAHMLDPVPPLTAHRPELPPGVDDVFARAMAKSPEDRYPTCRAMIAALRTELVTELGGSTAAQTVFGRATPPSRLVGPRETPPGSDDSHDSSARETAWTAAPSTPTPLPPAAPTPPIATPPTATPPTATPPTATPRQPRRRRRLSRSHTLLLVAAVAVAALASATVVAVNHFSGQRFEHVTGDARLPVALDRPAGWAQRVDPQATFRLFSPVDLTDVFSARDWTTADALLASDPGSVAGIYLQATDGIDTTDTDGILTNVSNALQVFGEPKITRDDDSYQVAQRRAVRFGGTLSEPGGPRRLQVDYYVVATDTPGITVEVMLVAAPDSFSGYDALFARTLSSLDVSRVHATS